MSATFEPIAPRPAPVKTEGVVPWLRRNLFSNWKNTLTTLVALGVLAYLLVVSNEDFQHLAGIGRAADVGEAAGEVDLDLLVAVANGVVKAAEVGPLGRFITRLFAQLAPRAGKQRFAGVDLARGEFDQARAQRVAVLPLQHHLPVVEQRDRHHRARVAQVFAGGDVPVGAAHAILVDTQKAAAPDFAAGQRFFGQGIGYGIVRHALQPKVVRCPLSVVS